MPSVMFDSCCRPFLFLPVPNYRYRITIIAEKHRGGRACSSCQNTAVDFETCCPQAMHSVFTADAGCNRAPYGFL
ncbi:hypothetical protein XELAEV_18001712mg [Xenopus laevis]|nr:hypothetical protein XELAEV_18001712mg [Xenopus laevis]